MKQRVPQNKLMAKMSDDGDILQIEDLVGADCHKEVGQAGLCRNHPVLYSQSLYQCLRDGGRAEVACKVHSGKVHNNVTGRGQVIWVKGGAGFEQWQLDETGFPSWRDP